MTLTIGSVDMTPYIAFGGVKWSRNDVEEPSAGRDMSGKMYRGRVATKIRLDITCRPLEKAEIAIVLNAIQPQFVTVTYDDPLYGNVTKTMYSNNVPATFLIKRPDGKEYWKAVTFPLIEE